MKKLDQDAARRQPTEPRDRKVIPSREAVAGLVAAALAEQRRHRDIVAEVRDYLRDADGKPVDPEADDEARKCRLMTSAHVLDGWVKALAKVTERKRAIVSGYTVSRGARLLLTCCSRLDAARTTLTQHEALDELAWLDAWTYTPTLRKLPGVARRHNLRLLKDEYRDVAALAEVTGLSLASAATLSQAAILMQAATTPGAVALVLRGELREWLAAVDERSGRAEEYAVMARERPAPTPVVVTWADVLERQ